MNERGPEFDESVACDNCGGFGAFAIGDRHLCEDCYQTQGACCPEFGGDDLWKLREKQRDEARSQTHDGRHPLNRPA